MSGSVTANGIVVNGNAGDDTLWINDPVVIPAGGLTFAAGAGNDDLNVKGNGADMTFGLNGTTAGSGTIDIDDGTTRRISFSGVEPNTITLTGAATVTLDLTGGDSVGFSQVSTTRSRAEGTVNAVEFDNPTTQLVVNMADANNYALGFNDLADKLQSGQWHRCQRQRRRRQCRR